MKHAARVRKQCHKKVVNYKLFHKQRPPSHFPKTKSTRQCVEGVAAICASILLDGFLQDDDFTRCSGA